MIISTSVDKISAALLAAQKEITSVKKTANNPFFKSKFADLTSVIEAVKDTLNKHQISVIQPHHGTVVETVLVHSSGQYIGSSTPIVCAKQNDPQALGSAISYARRYGLQSLVCLPAEDDDGETAMVRNEKPAKLVKASSSGDF